MVSKKQILKSLVGDKKLTSFQRVARRLGYMGTGFLIAGQWTLHPPMFVIGFILVITQVAARKQWNLVLLYLNGLAAWLLHSIY
jgi:hypothetical protein